MLGISHPESRIEGNECMHVCAQQSLSTHAVYTAQPKE